MRRKQTDGLGKREHERSRDRATEVATGGLKNIEMAEQAESRISSVMQTLQLVEKQNQNDMTGT